LVDGGEVTVRKARLMLVAGVKMTVVAPQLSSLGQLTMLARSHCVAAPAMLIKGEVARLGRD
jgi:siroheme synthase (precorrin-2 oxidase/ferrochelatase)